MNRRILVYIIAIFVMVLMYQVLTATLSSKPAIPDADPPVQLPISQNLPIPKTSARNIFILDQLSETVLYQLNADVKVYPASTTKMVTALVVLNEFPLQKTITVTKSYPLGVNAGFMAGEQITVEQLLYAMLVESANDAAEIFAENYQHGRTAFIEKMNNMSVQLHLTNTNFVNPTGLDEPNHYSSAADLTRIAQAVLKNPILAKIVSTENAVVATNTSPHLITNVNRLLGKVPGVLGIKTGFTDLAGQTLVTYVNRNNHPVIITILGSTDRFTDTKNIIEWVYSNFSWPTQLHN